MITTFHVGNPIYAEQDKDGVYSIWKYTDGTSIKKGNRPCPRCGHNDVKGHDHCIQNLPGVKYACCGHGVEDGYVKLYNGKVIRFSTDLNRKEILNLIKENK